MRGSQAGRLRQSGVLGGAGGVRQRPEAVGASAGGPEGRVGPSAVPSRLAAGTGPHTARQALPYGAAAPGHPAGDPLRTCGLQVPLARFTRGATACRQPNTARDTAL